MRRIVWVMLYFILDLVQTIYPVAIFHSQSTTCFEMQEMSTYIKNKITLITNEDVHVECIESGINTLLSSILSQSERACELIQLNSNFQTDFSVIGFSQGGLVARYIIQACRMKAKVRRFISIGGPQMGMGKIPECWVGAACYFINKAVGYLVYYSHFQKNFGAAGYFRITDNQKEYINKANFLPILNNEKQMNTTIYERFEYLEQLVLIKFLNDTKIFPKESAWFEFVDEQEKVIELENSEIYKKNCLSFEQLMIKDKLFRIAIEGDNCEINKEHIDVHIIPYLI